MLGQPELIIILRLVLAALLGGIIGLERESINRPAGLRTHTLVSVGATLAMLVSANLAGSDPGRIAAQVISGIGFLGAGTIMREGANVRGLTTAASLWVVAGIGLAVGAGMYLAASVGSVLVVATLMGLGRVEKTFLLGSLEHSITLEMADRPGQLGLVGTRLGQLNVHIRNIQVKQLLDRKTLAVELVLKLPPQTNIAKVTSCLLELEGIFGIEEG